MAPSPGSLHHGLLAGLDEFFKDGQSLLAMLGGFGFFFNGPPNGPGRFRFSMVRPRSLLVGVGFFQWFAHGPGRFFFSMVRPTGPGGVWQGKLHDVAATGFEVRQYGSRAILSSLTHLPSNKALNPASARRTRGLAEQGLLQLPSNSRTTSRCCAIARFQYSRF